MNTIDESLSRFGTEVFADEIIAAGWHLAALPPGLNGVQWTAIVPEAYRPQVDRIITQVFGWFRGTKMLPETLDMFLSDLRRAIWSRLEPVELPRRAAPEPPVVAVAAAPANESARVVELRAAIGRSEAKLQELLDPCQCPCCAGNENPAYATLSLKRELQEAWLAVLLAKDAGDAGALKQASARYAALAAVAGLRREQRRLAP